jgi:hypothetical protein
MVQKPASFRITTLISFPKFSAQLEVNLWAAVSRQPMVLEYASL